MAINAGSEGRIPAGDEAPPDGLIELDAALDRSAVADAQAAALLKLRIFAGLTVLEAASAIGISRRTVARDRTFARTSLYTRLAPRDDAGCRHPRDALAGAPARPKAGRAEGQRTPGG